MSYKSSYFRCLEHRLSTLNEDMDDQETLNVFNDKSAAEKLRSLLQQGKTTSFIFSIKNRVGGLARALKVFQENGINVVHIESRLSRRTNSEYEIYVDLEADRTRVRESMKQMQRQLSCVRFDMDCLTENINEYNSDTFFNTDGSTDTENMGVALASPFLDKNGEPIRRQKKRFNQCNFFLRSIQKKSMAPDKDCLSDSVNASLLNMKTAFDQHLYISPIINASVPVICFDSVLCYLSNVIGHGSLIEIEQNVKRYFTPEDINRASSNLCNCLNYSLLTLNDNNDHSVSTVLRQCLLNSADSNSFLFVMDTLHNNNMFSYLPLFVTNDWLHMIRSAQNLEQFDIALMSTGSLERQLSTLRQHLVPLNELVNTMNKISSVSQAPFNDQCCLRKYCSHSISMPCSAKSNEWTSANMNLNPITKASGFIRNPVTNFMMPATTTLSEPESSVNSNDGNTSSDNDAQAQNPFSRSVSYQTSTQKTGSIVVKRENTLWIYPIALIPSEDNKTLLSMNGSSDELNFEPVRSRANSCDSDFPHSKIQAELPKKQTKRSTKQGTQVEANETPWFPRRISDLDQCSNKVLLYGSHLDADHPGFKDNVYRARRMYFHDLAIAYKHGDPIPHVEYTKEEIETWGVVFRNLNKLYPTHACTEYLENWPLLREKCGFREDNIPQLEGVSRFLRERTGFTLRPVAGYLSPRDFLYGLAFRVFHCTQYIRHSSNPSYTPEPDCCHELLGHVPLLADPTFAQFSHEIGLAAIGASEEDINRLATCYFFTIEFGLCRQYDGLRVYGAGLLSSCAELQHALSDQAKKLPFDPEVVCKTKCLITTYQEQYFVSGSFVEAKDKMRQFALSIKRPFAVRYNPYNQSIEIVSNTQHVAQIISDLKGDMCIIFDALKKLENSISNEK